MFHSHIILLLILIGFISGYIDGVAGGGGLLMLPAYLSMGLPPHIALGTNKLSGSLGVLASSFAFIQKRVFKPYLWKFAILGGAIGAILGVIFVALLSANFLKQWLPIFIIAVAIYLLFRKHARVDYLAEDFIPPRLSSFLMGLILGIYNGFLGPGTGSFWVTATIFFYDLDLLRSSGVARFMNFVSNIIALFVFIALGQVNYFYGFVSGIALMIGSYIGAHHAIYWGARFIKPFLVTSVLLIAARLIWIEWF